MMIPFIYNKEPGDKIFGFLRRIYKFLFLKVPLTGQDVVQSLVVIITKEGTETTQPNRKIQTVINITLLKMCVHAFVCLLTACR